MDMFKKHINTIKKNDYNFYSPLNFNDEFKIPRKKKLILLTIDDAFESFYLEAWPFLKKNKIPFVLFVSTEPVGQKGYMTWKQIKDIEKESFVFLGHHSHSHKYLIDKTDEEFVIDIETANKEFLNNLGYIPNLFSYPFGEYSEFMKNYISKNFDFAFGQHSGVIDLNKDKYELPRFPINENYGKIKRFDSILKSYPLEYKTLLPSEKKINQTNNPPSLNVEFFDEQKKKLININCYSNELGEWKKSKIKIKNNILSIDFRGKFLPRRGRINCSLNDNGKWRWFGTQFVVKKN
jgi:peptidoglycan/xylan/chitin deacetylase (PgdA/CDA1 family)